MTARTRCRTAALAALLGGIVSVGAAPSPARPATYTVTIDGTRFQPDVLTVKIGDSVVWLNKDPFPHTATSKEGGFDSKAIAAGGSWKYKAAKRGDFTYVCTFHPTMSAVLHVQ